MISIVSSSNMSLSPTLIPTIEIQLSIRKILDSIRRHQSYHFITKIFDSSPHFHYLSLHHCAQVKHRSNTLISQNPLPYSHWTNRKSKATPFSKKKQDFLLSFFLLQNFPVTMMPQTTKPKTHASTKREFNRDSWETDSNSELDDHWPDGFWAQTLCSLWSCGCTLSNVGCFEEK